MAYTYEEKIDIFKGQCFNNACVLIAGISKSLYVENVFELADKLFVTGMERGWVKKPVELKLDRKTGKVLKIDAVGENGRTKLADDDEFII